MKTICYYKNILVGKLLRRGNDYIVTKMREEGMEIGSGTHIFSNIASSEPYLVSIGNNCTISTDVVFITHDASIGLFGGGRNEASDICGKISVGDNVFIGNRSLILYGVTIPSNTIVAAGSVVTKSFEETGCIIGGNPAKIIGKVDNFLQKTKSFHLKLNGLSPSDRKCKILNSNLIVR